MIREISSRNDHDSECFLICPSSPYRQEQFDAVSCISAPSKLWASCANGVPTLGFGQAREERLAWLVLGKGEREREREREDGGGIVAEIYE